MVKCSKILAICYLFFVFSAEVVLAGGDTPVTEESFNTTHGKWERSLDSVERQIKEGKLDDQLAGDLRTQLAEVRDAALGKSQTAAEKSRELKKLIDALGPIPEEGQPDEAYEVARERRELGKQLRDAAGHLRQSDLIRERSDILLREISTVEIDQIVSNLAHQDPLPLDPRVWIKAGSQFFKGYKSFIVAHKGGEYSSPILVVLPLLLIGVLLAYVVGFWIRRGLLSRYRRNANIESPTYRQRVIAAIGVGIGRGLVPVFSLIVFGGIAWTYWLQDQLDPQFSWPAGIFQGVIFYLLGAAIIRAIFSPRLPQWNLTWVSFESSRKIAYRLRLLVAVLGTGIAFGAILEDTGKAAEFGSVYAFVKNSLLSIILLFITRKPLWQGIEKEGEEAESADLWFWPYLRLVTAIIALAALICSILGFHNIAEFILPRIILTGLLAALFVTARVLIRESFSLLLERESGFSQSLRGSLAIDYDTGRRLNFWIMTLVDLTAILGAAYLLLILWKFPHQDIVHWLSGWFKGISIGSYTFSLADVLLAFGVMFGVITLTKVIRSLLENRLLPQTSMDIGIKTAISSGVGYAGVLFAILLALSTLGIDLTKLALIAGALSVGIGFGLQNIVNNFVSGLVLLFERPIKIGDWVVLGQLEGKVKQINVRSTEIETFSSASVIIPNSDLLQTAVINWTHKSTFGRIEVAVGVSYDSDIEQVEALLIECAQEHSEVLSWPTPYVFFLGFGDSSLDFQLYIYVDNVERRLRISSDLRKSIFSRFKAAGIEIPFPQRVVTFHQASSATESEIQGSALKNRDEEA